MRKLPILILCICSLHLQGLAQAPGSAWRFVPPAGSGVVNVKDYGAKGDGRTDDTKAIEEAITANINKSRYRANPMIWFPDGTYLVSGPVEGRNKVPGYDKGKVFSAGWGCMLMLIGETRSGAVIKLKDNADGYGDAAKPRWIVATGSESEKKDNYGGGGNRAFRHGILNLTVDAGSGNPGAIGIDFISSNRGTVDGVTVKAAPGSGHTGIAMTRAWPGPAIIMDVRVEGFARGMALDHYQYGMTFENIHLSGQRVIGVHNTNNVLAMRRVTYRGSASFYNGTKGHSYISLLDSDIQGEDASGGAALSSAGMVNLRRVSVSGFKLALDDTSKANNDLAAGKIVSHDQGTALSATGGKPEPLNLPIEEIPLVRPPEGTEWTDGGDSRQSIQAAIDGGAEWIYLKPAKSIKLDDTLILRGKTRLIMGLTGCIVGPKGKPAIRVDEGQVPMVVMEHVYIDGMVEHPSSRTFVLRHGDINGLAGGPDEFGIGLRATGTGKTHVIDVIGRGYLIGPRHSCWARQLNAEFGERPLFTNAGRSWLLGFKMETSPRGSKNAPNSTPSIVNESGSLELFGGVLYTLGTKNEHAPLVPAFTNERGSLAVGYRTNGKPETYYKNVLRLGSFESGKDITSDKVKGPGAALLTDQR